MDTLHDAHGRAAVAKPVTGDGLPSPRLLLLGGTPELRSRLAADLPEFQLQADGEWSLGGPTTPDLLLVALPLSVAGRACLSALPPSGRPPVVALVDTRDEPLAHVIAPGIDEVITITETGAWPDGLAARLIRRIGRGPRPAAGTDPAPGRAATDARRKTPTLVPVPAPAAAPADADVLGLADAEPFGGPAAPGSVAETRASLADLIDDAVIEFDASCRVLTANLAAATLAQRSQGEMIGRTCAEILPPGEGCGDRPCLARRASEQRHEAWLERERGERSVQVHATPRPDGSVVWREADVTNLRQVQRQLARSLDSLERANSELVARAACLERVVQASTDLKSATTRDELADRVLGVLADLPGFSLVAVGLQDEEFGATQMAGIARLPGGLAVPLGRRTVLLDILNLSPERRRVSNSQVVLGLCVSIHGSPDTWGPRTAAGEWDLAEVFDGAAVALTPLRASARSHGFLLVKAALPSAEIDPESLRVVEILANLAAGAFDNLRLQEAERRRAALTGMVSKLGRALIEVRDPDQVLEQAARGLRNVLEGTTVESERVRETAGSPSIGGILAGPRVVKAPPERVPAPGALAPVASQLVVPIRVGERVRAVITASSASRAAFDDVDMSAIELFAKVVGKAHANADLFRDEQASLERLRLVAEIGRIASASLDLDEVLARSLAHLCQHRAYELAAVTLLDESRGKLVLRAQASRTGVRMVDGLSTRLSEGTTGRVASTGVAMIVPDVTAEPSYLAVDPSVRSELCVPLLTSGHVLGVLDVESHEVAAFDEGDLAALTSIADHLAAALNNARLYQQVTDKNRELRDSERNKSDFLSIVAHDLRTPLTSIRSAAEMILMYRDEPPEVTEDFTRSIRDEAARLGRLVDDFLAHSRMEAGILDYEVGEVDLAAMLEHFCRVFDGPASLKRIALEKVIAPGLPPVLADKERLSQVVANLLSNATKFTPEGGHITVKAWALPAEPEQVIGRVRVDVSDDGPGIEGCHRERIFQKFVRLDGGAGGGAGLGLPIARAIIEHLGGKLWLDGEARHGSTFSFVLPARLR